MVLFNYSTKELTAKIVFYGPGLCGKTTNLQYIFSNLPPNIHKGKMLSLATQTDRTLFFDFLPIDLGTIRGMKTRLQLYTVPGQVFYNTTRKLVLKGADGLVFVADSQRKMLEADKESFGNLEENLREHGMDLAQIPHVIQFNKRDLSDVLTPEELNAALNKYNAPIYEAVATTGIGVHDTLKAVTRIVLNSLKTRYEGKKSGKPAPAPIAAARAPEPIPAPPPPAPEPPVAIAEPEAAVMGSVMEIEEPVLAIDAEEVGSDVLEVEAEPEALELDVAGLEQIEEVEEVHEIEEAAEVELIEDEPSPLQVEPEEAVSPLSMESDEVELLEIEEGLDDSAAGEPFGSMDTDQPSPVANLGPLSEHMDEESLPPVSFDLSPMRSDPSPLNQAAASMGAAGISDGATVAVSVAPRDLSSPAGSEALTATSPGEFTFPITLEIQGKSVTIKVTLGLKIEQS
jgi:signal recognition particle receptor subunit beta